MIKGSAPVAKDLEAILRATVEDWRSEARRRAAARMDADLGELDRAYIGRHGANRSEASEGEEEVRLEVAVQRNRLGSELSELRNELQPLLAMALQGEWGVRSWPKDIKAAAQKGAGSAQDAKTALDVQAQIFQRQESEEWLKEAILSMVKCTKDFQAQLAPKFGEVQRRQRELSAQRAEYLQQTCQKEEQQLKESEAEVLKAIAKLVPEVEAMTELGSVASPFGAPLGLVAGCWRRAIKCMLPALLRLWDLAGTEPGEQERVLAQLLAVLEQFGVSPPDGVEDAAQNELLSSRKAAPEKATFFLRLPRGGSIASRSPEPEMDGVMRRAGAGRSSGGGPSSICLGDPGQSKRPQRAFSADVARSSRAREDFQAMRRVTTGRDCEAWIDAWVNSMEPAELQKYTNFQAADFQETSPDLRARSPRESARSMREEALDRARSPREDAAQSARSPRRSEASWRRSEASARGADCRETASWRRPSEAGRLGYEELEEENWRLREEVGRLRGELEKYQDWYAKLTSSYYNGNGFLK
ncbi:unnamed protein product [Effrenium voratum]|nr:unnamed protein product [Effrenium voratum]